MRKMTIRILITVIVTLVACMFGLQMLARNVDHMAVQYEENIKKSTESQKIVAQICENIYHMESLVWQHVVNEDEKEYAVQEERLDILLQEMSGLLIDLQDSLGDGDDSAVLHEVIRQYTGFKNNTEVTLDLSRKGSKQSAQYYVHTRLNPYFDMVNELLETTDQRMEENSRIAAEEMEQRIRMARLEVMLCFFAVGAIAVVCVALVFRQSKRIVGKQGEESQLHQQRVMELQYNIIVSMANLIESRDEDTGFHVKRTSWFVDKIARRLAKDSPYREELTEEYLDNLWKAAPLHDIGKIKIPDAILSKPGKLTPEEFERMKTHAQEGGKIVYETMQGIEEREYIEMAYNVAKYHHEKWNGTGYPEGLSGQNIPLCARIMAVADVFDALVSKRCYKPAMTVEEAYRIIEESVGTHFDPVVAKAFIELRPEVEQFLKENQG